MSQCLDKFCFWFNLLAFCICVNSWKRSFCSRPLTPFFSTSYTPFTTLCLSFHTHTHIYIFRHIHTHTHTHTFRHKHFLLISTSKISTNYDKILIQDQTDQDFQMIQNLWTKSWIAEIIDKDQKIVESFCRNTQKKMCENEIDDVIITTNGKEKKIISIDVIIRMFIIFGILFCFARVYTWYTRFFRICNWKL